MKGIVTSLRKVKLEKDIRRLLQLMDGHLPQYTDLSRLFLELLTKLMLNRICERTEAVGSQSRQGLLIPSP